MVQRVKAATLNRVTEEGYTDGYGALVHLAAVIGTDPEGLSPKSDEERFAWGGHLKGLRAALLCLAMHERGIAPEPAALVVSRHIEDAMSDLEHAARAGCGGGR
ncbi:hypothetical protein [Catenulispora pinisilvae]|uniref:hypothetical protein n=1 Tax=Catenulispora pinisilvae TaxID=2705253 RepID=UPI001891A13B|nr:hypothetical protein [Catenulispora pinisilvae]